MADFHNFFLKIDTGITKRVVKSFPEIRNTNDVIVYVWFIYLFLDKNIKKTWNVKNNNFKCTKFTMKS